MDIQEQLKDFGLTKLETAIYLYLLSHGLSTPPQISKGIKLARPNCYEVLDRLKEKDLIKEHINGTRKSYTAHDPVVLEQMAERRRDQIHALLPELRTVYSTQKNKPKIEFFEGFEQIKIIFDKTLTAPEVFGIASTKQLFSHDKKFFVKYRSEVQKRGIVFHDILTHASRAEAGPSAKEQLKALYEMKFLPAEYEDVPADVLIWNDSVALIVTEDPVYGIVMTNPHLTKLLKIMYGFVWKQV